MKIWHKLFSTLKKIFVKKKRFSRKKKTSRKRIQRQPQRLKKKKIKSWAPKIKKAKQSTRTKSRDLKSQSSQGRAQGASFPKVVPRSLDLSHGRGNDRSGWNPSNRRTQGKIQKGPARPHGNARGVPVQGNLKTGSKRDVSSPSIPSVKLGPLIGEITHFFSKIQVCVVKITGSSLKLGDQVRIVDKDLCFSQSVKSMQVESVDVRLARKGYLVGLKLDKPAKAGARVYKEL